MKELIPMEGAEFIDKVLIGERDFRRIRLEQGYDLSMIDSFKAMHDYISDQLQLREQDFLANPIDISDSDLTKLKAKGLYLKGESA